MLLQASRGPLSLLREEAKVPPHRTGQTDEEAGIILHDPKEPAQGAKSSLPSPALPQRSTCFRMRRTRLYGRLRFVTNTTWAGPAPLLSH